MNTYVYKPDIARKLLKIGYTIVDLKPMKRENGLFDFTRSIYVFKDSDGKIEESIKSIIKKTKYEND